MTITHNGQVLTSPPEMARVPAGSIVFISEPGGYDPSWIIALGHAAFRGVTIYTKRKEEQ